MGIGEKVRKAGELLGTLVGQPRESKRHLVQLPFSARASQFCTAWTSQGRSAMATAERDELQGGDANPLAAFYSERTQGRGINKWHQYFEVYHRHLQRFAGTDCRLLEVGVFSGGSLEMWRQYLGPTAQITGVDIEDACKAYESEGTRVLIGDQSDRSFWKTYREQQPQPDIIIDDGGHEVEQQIITLEEMLPFLRSGGIYICEDVHGADNKFAHYVSSIANTLHAYQVDPVGHSAEKYACSAVGVQSVVHSVHIYPYLVVIERLDAPRRRLTSERRGTEWAPFA